MNVRSQLSRLPYARWSTPLEVHRHITYNAHCIINATFCLIHTLAIDPPQNPRCVRAFLENAAPRNLQGHNVPTIGIHFNYRLSIFQRWSWKCNASILNAEHPFRFASTDAVRFHSAPQRHPRGSPRTGMDTAALSSREYSGKRPAPGEQVP